MSDERPIRPTVEDPSGNLPNSPVSVSPFIPAFEPIVLNHDAVHVWFIHLDRARARLEALTEVLAGNEIERADRFHSAEDRRNFVLAKGILREILSRYTKIPPHQLAFSHNSYGKPFLDENSGGSEYSFNVSHSREVALCAVAYQRQVGVDIEFMRDDVDYEQIADRFFSSQEALKLGLLPAHEKSRAFYACWTRKEAYIKAKGRGLSLNLKSFDVAFAPDEPARLLHVENDPAEPDRWSLTNLDVSAEYSAALVVEGQLANLKYFHL